MIHSLVTLDPGKDFGWALFKESVLVYCGLGKGDDPDSYSTLADFCHAREAVIEVPQIYSQNKWKGDPNDLITLAVMVGQAKQEFYKHTDRIQLIKPRDWKGNRPKEVDNPYTLSRLSAKEMQLVKGLPTPKGKLHNVIDAIGIGLWKLKRR